MTDVWNASTGSVSLGQPGAMVTLVQGSAFCISGRTGDIVRDAPQGLFFRDLRLLSRFELRINGQSLEPLAARTPDPFSAECVSRSRPRPGRTDSPLMVFRRRYIGRGMREDIEIRNFGPEPAFCSIELYVDVDFADLFEVKEGRVEPTGEHSVEHVDGGLEFRVRRGGVRRGARVTSSEPVQAGDRTLAYEVIVPQDGVWSTCIQVTPSIDGVDVEPRYRCGQPVERATPRERHDRWRQSVPSIETDVEALTQVMRASIEDLGALRMFDPEVPERVVVAAGAPWFMTLFGRDSLLTSWMALPVDPDLALGVLQTLARFQGSEVDPRREEEPGKILHEMRFAESASLSLGGGRVYYGTADATPLFVMLLGELRRWGLATEAVDQLIPHADRALEWIETFGDRDGDGYVEYQRASDRGPANQGWKDSYDAVRFRDGTLARPPIALAEVQGYVYAAYVARMHFALEAGDAELAARWRDKAVALKDAFNRDFWLEDRGCFAMALDGDNRPVDSLASNMGHCLWTGIVDRDKAAHVAERLLSPEMFSGWGVRTLATTEAGYNPISYHCGSVWPHENALIASGLMRYGFVDEAQRIILAQLDAAASQGGRLPELFTGLHRDEFDSVVPYPTSCSPQAWAAAAPFLWLRTLLRFDPWIPQGKLWLAPSVPEELGRLVLDRIPLAGARVRIEVVGDEAKVEGLPAGVDVITEPRAPLSAA